MHRDNTVSERRSLAHQTTRATVHQKGSMHRNSWSVALALYILALLVVSTGKAVTGQLFGARLCRMT